MPKSKKTDTEYAYDPRLESALAAATAEIGDTSIGRLSEKLLHRTLKHYLEPDPAFHEIDCLGSVADIKRDDNIIEIQTRAFNRLAPKLARFLEEHSVSVIYPLVTDRLILWCDPESGDIVDQRRGTKKGRPCDILPELSSIERFIGHERLSIIIIPVTVRELRLLDGYGKDKRKRATRVNTVPTSIGEPIRLFGISDIAALLPESLSTRFCSADWSRALRHKGIRASITLRFLTRVGIVECVSRETRPFVYEINPSFVKKGG